MSNPERAAWIQRLLKDNQIDVVICSLPLNVLMLSGYWPVVGTAVAAAWADGHVSLVVPEDEADLARNTWADDLRTFSPGSLEKLEPAGAAIRKPLTEIVRISAARIGFENGEISQPASYSAMHLYGGSMGLLLAECFPHATAIPADAVLSALRARKTAWEIDRLRITCEIASRAFRDSTAAIAVNSPEITVASTLERAMATGTVGWPEVQRSQAFVWCMSGANSALAARAYAQSRTKKIARGDLVLIHCNSCADGYWSDITRTFCAGPPDDRQAGLYEAVLEARQAALNAIRPGVSAASVDQAAREVLTARGLGSAFKHSTGHGVGFGAISAHAVPRLHPASPDILETGMVCNVEPAVYFDDYGGIRHCDMVAVTPTGYELLTPFQGLASDLILEVSL